MGQSFRNFIVWSFVASAMALVACSSSWELPDSFAPEIYPPPVPTLSAGGAILAGCPNPAGLEELERISNTTAIALLESIWSDDPMMSKMASDPALWPMLTTISPRQAQPQTSWLDGPVLPATDSPYASSLEHQCGETIVDASWTFTVCPGSCQDNASASLKEDFFLLSRAGQLLIWAVWP